MALRVVPAAPLVLAFLLAGCSGSADEPPVPDDPGEGERTSREDGSKLVAVPTSFEDVAWDGDVGTQFCIDATGTDVCPTGTLGPPTAPLELAKLRFVAATEGPAVLSGNFSLTWDTLADFSLTQSLIASLGVYSGCPDACHLERMAGQVTDRSPLTLPLDGIQLDGGQRIGLSLRPVHSQVTNGIEFRVATGQAVHLGGVIGSAPL